jgi:type I restriction enzyme S subunit
MSRDVPMRQLVAHAIGGGWGYDEPSEDTAQVAVIRGADFPAVAIGDASQIPIRWEKTKKLPSRLLQPCDILLEISGGSSGRPTGRTVFMSRRLLGNIGRQAIPASFCRLVRIDPAQADPYYVYWWLQGMYAAGRTWAYQNRSTGIANFQFEYFLDTELVRLPSIQEQQEIAATLGSLDNKIESSHRQRELSRLLGSAKLQMAAAAEGIDVRLADVATSIARGVAPRYADDDPAAPLVINQKCIRSGWVDTTLARRMVSRTVSPGKRGQSGDIFVNSTGTGTLGRVGRWHRGEVFVDGHVTIVRPDASSIGPAVLAYALLGREADIEAMATGSTGQTELSPARLGDLVVRVPSKPAAEQLEADLVGVEERIASLFAEEATLLQLRNVLLPELLSGRIRASETAATVEVAG